MRQIFQGLVRAFSAKKHAPTSLAPFVFDPRTRALVCNGLPGHVQFYSVDTDKQLFSVSVSVSTVWSGLELWRAGRILMFCHIFFIYYIKLQRVSMCLYVCLSVPPFFQHDRRKATKFVTHMRIDLGMVQA